MLDDYVLAKSILLKSLGDTPLHAARQWWNLSRQPGNIQCSVSTTQYKSFDSKQAIINFTSLFKLVTFSVMIVIILLLAGILVLVMRQQSWRLGLSRVRIASTTTALRRDGVSSASPVAGSVQRPRAHNDNTHKHKL